MNNLLLHTIDFSRECQQNCRHYSKLAPQFTYEREKGYENFTPPLSFTLLLVIPPYCHSRGSGNPGESRNMKKFYDYILGLI